MNAKTAIPMNVLDMLNGNHIDNIVFVVKAMKYAILECNISVTRQFSTIDKVNDILVHILSPMFVRLLVFIYWATKFQDPFRHRSRYLKPAA